MQATPKSPRGDVRQGGLGFAVRQSDRDKIPEAKPVILAVEPECHAIAGEAGEDTASWSGANRTDAKAFAPASAVLMSAAFFRCMPTTAARRNRMAGSAPDWSSGHAFDGAVALFCRGWQTRDRAEVLRRKAPVFRIATNVEAFDRQCRQASRSMRRECGRIPGKAIRRRATPRRLRFRRV